MVSFGNGGSGIVMAFQEDLSDEGGDGDDRIGGGEEMFSTEGGTRTFGKVAGEDDEWAGINEARSKKGGPVVVSVMGVKDAGTGTAENASEGENLHGAEARKRVVRKFLGDRREGGLGGAGAGCGTGTILRLAPRRTLVIASSGGGRCFPTSFCGIVYYMALPQRARAVSFSEATVKPWATSSCAARRSRPRSPPKRARRSHSPTWLSPCSPAASRSAP